MKLQSIVAIILVIIFVGSYLFVTLRMYVLVKRIDKDNKKLKKFLKIVEEEESK